MGRVVPAILAVLILLAASGCGLMGGEETNDGSSPREQRASQLVSAEVGEPVECKDNGAVNVELHPEYPVGYSCYNEAGVFIQAMVSPDGRLLSVSRPINLKPAEDS